ncbi:hypothetical protein BH11MYX4_BH11MYX4_56690 [soil metagenome]
MTRRHIGFAIATISTLAAAGGCSIPADDAADVAMNQPSSDPPQFDSVGHALTAELRWDRAVNRQAGLAEPLAIVQTAGGELVEFYDHQGRLLVSGVRPPSASGRPIHTGSFAHGKGFDPRILWEVASGGAPVPPGLEHLLTRSGHAMVSGGAPLGVLPVPSLGPTPDPAGRRGVNPDRARASQREPKRDDGNAPPPGEVGVAKLNGFCRTSYYWQDVPGDAAQFPLGACPSWDWNVCWDNVTGSGWASHPDVSVMRMNICPYRGSLTVSISADESGPVTGSWTVGEDFYRWWEYANGDCDRITAPWDDCPTISASITNADGDGYNFRYNVYDW